MKNVLLVAMTAVLGFCLVACGGDDDADACKEMVDCMETCNSDASEEFDEISAKCEACLTKIENNAEKNKEAHSRFDDFSECAMESDCEDKASCIKACPKEAEACGL